MVFHESLKTVDAAFAYLEAFANFERQTPMVEAYRLDRMAAMLADFKNPQLSIPAIHIAGSKGKGTCTYWLASALTKLGYKVGRYTSPHLSDYRERISSADGFYGDERYLSVINRIMTYVDGLGSKPDWHHGEPTTFELLTLAAYLIFQEEQLDWMVIETGLGGLLDATNLMQPVLCLVTALELEHTDILGDTIEAIAGQKAGIFKPGALLVAQSPADGNSPVVQVLAAAAAKVAGQISWVPFVSENQNQENVREVLQILWSTGHLTKAASQDAVFAAADDAITHTDIPGRLQWYSCPPARLLLDVSHTPSSVQRALDSFMPRPDDFLLFGSVSGKRHEDMAAVLGPAFQNILVTTPGTFKKSDPVLVWRSFQRVNPAASLEIDPLKAFSHAQAHLAASPGARLLICGSFYLAGAVLPLIQLAGFKTGSERAKIGKQK